MHSIINFDKRITSWLWSQFWMHQEISPLENNMCCVRSIIGYTVPIDIQNIQLWFSHSKIITYNAEDTIHTLLPRKTTEDIQIKLQEDFNAVAEWLQSMDLVCNMKNESNAIWNSTKKLRTVYCSFSTDSRSFQKAQSKFWPNLITTTALQTLFKKVFSWFLWLHLYHILRL